MPLFLALVAVDLLIFAPLVGWLATQKNRSFMEGAIVGAVFGVLGLLVMGLAPTNTGQRRGLSPVAMVLLVAILALILWAAAGLPGT